ncbi:hypothetical protein GLIP_1230 [Aliiglaciecola lipolytica E3]|uniref:Uncharacterized protein n=2 Tax=Aliiglaciecola TaxID=1406885 RepID=K6XQC3_9ALTE|nr:hypothetical protein GLIP_1230 [Aliiglaciecola lipolytica E3]
MRKIDKACLFIASILYSLYSFAEDNLPIECQTVPNKQIDICTLSTQSEHYPVNDLILYKREDGRFFVYLETIKGDVAGSWFWGFSNQGKYAVMSFAEEGHPHFVFYDTEQFLQSEQRPKPISVVSDYFLGQLMELRDDGTAIFGWTGGLQNSNQDSQCLEYENVDAALLEDECFVSVNIFADEHKSIN